MKDETTITLPVSNRAGIVTVEDLLYLLQKWKILLLFVYALYSTVHDTNLALRFV